MSAYSHWPKMDQLATLAAGRTEKEEGGDWDRVSPSMSARAGQQFLSAETGVKANAEDDWKFSVLGPQTPSDFTEQ